MECIPLASLISCRFWKFHLQGQGWTVERLQQPHGGGSGLGGRPMMKNNLIQASKWPIGHCCGLRTRSHHSSWYPILPYPRPIWTAPSAIALCTWHFSPQSYSLYLWLPFLPWPTLLRIPSTQKKKDHTWFQGGGVPEGGCCSGGDPGSG